MLKQTEELARSIVETIREPVLVLDEQRKVVSASQSFYQKFKTAQEETEGEFLFELGNKQWNSPAFRHLLEEMFAGKKKIKGFEFSYNFPATGDRTFLLNAGELQTPLSEEKLILISFEDITRKKRRLKKEKQRLNSFQTILAQAPAAICTLRGREHIFELANEKYFQLIKKRDILGKPFKEAVPELKDQGYLELLDRVFLTGEPFIGKEMILEHESEDKNSSRTYIDFICQPITDADNNVTGIFANAVDVTEKVLARKKIEESEKRLRMILDNVPAIIWITGTNCEASFVNKPWYEYTGMRAGELGGLDWLQLIHPEDRESFRRIFAEATSRAEAYSETYRLRTKDGDYRWVMDSGRPKYGIEGRYEGLIGTIIDVHEEKVKEQLIREKEHRIRSLVEEAAVPMAVYTGPEMNIALANEAMKAIWRKDFDPIGKTFRKVLPELEGKPYFQLLQDVYLTGTSYAFEEEQIDIIEDKKIYKGYYNFSYKPLRTENGQIYGVLNIAVDVTEQVRTRMLLLESESHFRQMADVMPAKISHTNSKGQVVYFNQNWLDYTGAGSEELKAIGWLKFVHPDDQERFKNNWLKVVEQGTSFEEEMRLRHYSGTYKWHLTRAEAIKDEAGDLKMWIGTTIEIHKIKEEEKRKEDFLKMVSHELKTPVTSIKGYVQLLLSLLGNNNELPLDSLPLKPSLERIDQQIVRLTRLISEILDISRIEENKLELQKETFSINELVDQTVQDIFFTNIQHRIKVSHNFRANLNGDRDRIGQVLINFITNAIKYSPERKSIEVEVHQVKDGRVGVSVKDEGIGIEKKDQKNIFRRFYRVSEEKEDTYSGFGIGLYLAKEIIQRHKGEIVVNSKIGKGSSFTFILATA